MPIAICHRINRAAALAAVPLHCGVEIDVRSIAGSQQLYLHHDPFVPGEPFGDWLAAWEARRPSGPIILNTKEDGLEGRLLDAMHAAQIANFFFLDTTQPTLVKLLGRGLQKHLCQRISRFESTEVLASYAAAGLPSPAWTWIDCFFTEPPPAALLESLAGTARRCLVSPELQGGPPESIETFLPLRPYIDAVCTKHIERWTP